MGTMSHMKAEYDLNRFGANAPTHVPNYKGEPYYRDNGEIWIATSTAAAGWRCNLRYCTGTPEGAVTAPVGTLAVRSDGGASTTLYVKQSGTGNTGWVAK